VKEIFWVGHDGPGNLAIVLRPRGEDWLEDELRRMKEGGVQTVVSMLEPEEAELLGLSAEEDTARRLGLGYLSFAIQDRGTPSNVEAFREFIAGLAARVQAVQRIGVHCRGCIGRATIAVACTLIHLGWKPERALEEIEKARGCTVPDTPEQRDWILRYEARQ
jgi:protein-tyrosine phosphatase